MYYLPGDDEIAGERVADVVLGKPVFCESLVKSADQGVVGRHCCERLRIKV